MYAAYRNDSRSAPRPLPGLVQTRVIQCRAGTRTLPVHLAQFDRAQFDLSAFAHAGIVLPPAIERSARKRQAEYFFGRAMARRALAEAGIDACQIESGAQREPLWPDGVVGAITHNQTLAGACVAHAGPWRGIGIDIESALDDAAAASVEDRALCGEERERLRAHAALPYPMLLAIAFSAKESFYKALFPTVGRYFGFEAIRLERFDAGAGRWQFTTRETLCPVWPAGSTGQIGFMLLDGSTVLTWFAW